MQLNELTNSVDTANFGRNVPTTHGDRSGVARRLGRARLQQGIHRQRAARTGAARLGERRLVPPEVRQPDHHRRPALQHREGQLRRPVLRERAGRPEPAGRRRLPGLRPVRSEAVGRRAEPAAEQPAQLLGRTSAARRTSTQGYDVSINARPQAGRVRPGRHQRAASASFDRVQARRRRHAVAADQRRATGGRDARGDRDLPGRQPRLPSGSIRIVPTSRCSARTRCRSTSSSAARTSSAAASRPAARRRAILATWTATPAAATTLGRRVLGGRRRPGSST